MTARRSFYVTTPIYYVNDLPHIGHTYTTVVADALARYHRLTGDEVYFLTGTDEHGQKIERAAAKRGIAPLALADEVVENYKQLWPALAISHDDFIRTTETRHQAGVYELFRKIREKSPDAIYKGSYRGLYCTGCEAFFTAAQLVDGRCPEQGHPVEEVEESSWFFRLSDYQDRLLALYERQPEFVLPETRRNEVRAFVASGLRDLSISRSKEKVGWGIPFPGDPDHVVYVWFDALTNYLSALGYGSDDPRKVARYWHNEKGHTALHLVGKDILRFHAVYWPAFLMAAGEELPRTVFGHGWWLKDDAKMSKTAGNIARPGPLLETFGPDALRWFLLREIPLGLDGSYSDEAVLERTNADLANNVGNLYSRVLALIAKNEAGVVPGPDGAPADPVLDEAARAARAAYRAGFEAHDPSAALRALTEWADALNKYLVRHEPWKRPGREALTAGVLGVAAQHLAQIALRLHPAMPVAAARLWRMLGLGEDPAREIAAGVDLLELETLPVAGRRVAAGDAVFPRLDRKAVFGDAAPPATPPVGTGLRAGPQKDTPVSDSPAPPPAPVPAPAPPPPDGLITIDDFAKVQLRCAKVLVCERHPNAEKLLRLEVDLGGERRQLVAGIASAYQPEDLVGRTIVVVANLKPAKLRGLESQGMLLAATGPDGVPHVLGPDGEVPPGSKVS